jgi:NodT family efflux transporter outer membrane factor (OMF) lipoprotein
MSRCCAPFVHRLVLEPALAVLTLASIACPVGPKYTRPSAPVPPEYKEQTPDAYKETSSDWKQANPGDGVLRGKWWEIYNDKALNALEEQVNISNQNVLAAEASFREARAAVHVARSALFPTVTTAPGMTISRAQSGLVNPGSGQVAAAGGGIGTYYTLPVDVSYQADVWGSIRRSVTAASDTAQASAADLENARLSYQAMLAEDYFELHGVDAQKHLLDTTVKSYQEYLDLTKYRYASGIASAGDVALAETQLNTTRAQLIGLGVQRAQYEHAIAILTGKPPAEVSLPEVPLSTIPPNIPPGLPSQLLERRPDIAAAERTVAAANEQIGIAKAAFFPTVTLTGAAGFASSAFLQWLTWPSRFWSVGPQLAETLFDAGKRRAQVAEMQASYDNTVANYRQTVLTAFQQVEDQLAAIRIYTKQLSLDQQAVKNAREAVRVFTNQYRSGIVDLTTVVTAETNLLSQEETLLTVRQNLFLASVSLIEALGGGWDTTLLPTQVQLMKGFSLLPKLESTPPALEAAPADTTLRNPQSAPQVTQ